MSSGQRPMSNLYTALSRTQDLLHDCHSRIDCIRCGGRWKPVIYIYYMAPDQGLDGVLIHLYHNGEKGVMPHNLIGTVASVSRLRENIRGLRAVYKDAVIAIRVWTPRGVGQLVWDEPLVLDASEGPIAILADPPTFVEGRKVFALQIHPDSRVGEQYLCLTRNDTSANVFLSNVGFLPSPAEHLLVSALIALATAVAATALLPFVTSLVGKHARPTTASKSSVAGLIALLTGLRSGRASVHRLVVDRLLRRPRQYADSPEDVFMPRASFERPRGVVAYQIVPMLTLKRPSVVVQEVRQPVLPPTDESCNAEDGDHTDGEWEGNDEDAVGNPEALKKPAP